MINTKQGSLHEGLDRRSCKSVRLTGDPPEERRGRGNFGILSFRSAAHPIPVSPLEVRNIPSFDADMEGGTA